MPGYRRVTVAGGTYFFTVVTHRRRDILCDNIVRHALREGICHARESHPFQIDAWVLLPDHLHCIWTLPECDGAFSLRWVKIKQYVTGRVEEVLHRDDLMTDSKRRRGEGSIWQRRFWEHQIRDERDYEKHMNYIHYNPVKHGLVNQVVDWPWSTFHRYVASGVYPEVWGGGDWVGGTGDYGETRENGGA